MGGAWRGRASSERLFGQIWADGTVVAYSLNDEERKKASMPFARSLAAWLVRLFLERGSKYAVAQSPNLVP